MTASAPSVAGPLHSHRQANPLLAQSFGDGSADIVLHPMAMSHQEEPSERKPDLPVDLVNTVHQ